MNDDKDKLDHVAAAYGRDSTMKWPWISAQLALV